MKLFLIKIIKTDSKQACYVVPRQLDQMVGIQWQIARGQAAASAAQRGFEGGPYISSFSNVSNAGTLITIFPSCFQIHICECFKISSYNFKINMNKKSVKYLKGISFSHLTLTKKTEITYFGHSAPDLVISQSSSSRTCEKI
jgi:hypothetical protein